MAQVINNSSDPKREAQVKKLRDKLDNLPKRIVPTTPQNPSYVPSEDLTPYQEYTPEGINLNTDYQTTASDRQTTMELVGDFFGNATTTGIGELAKIIGYVGGGIIDIAEGTVGNLVDLATGEDNYRLDMDATLDNMFNNGVTALQKELGPHTIMPSNFSQRSVWDQVTDGRFWAEQGGHGVGFILSMFAPGAILKMAKVGARTTSALTKNFAAQEAAGTIGTLGDRFLKSYGRTGHALNNAARLENYIDSGAAVLANTLIEAAAEGSNTFDNMYAKYKKQGMSDAEARALAGEKASTVFKGNMAILAVSNLILEKYLLKGFGGPKSGLSSINKKGFNEFIESGMEQAVQINKRPSIGNFAKAIGAGFVQEGFIEEGFQTSLEQYASHNQKNDGLIVGSAKTTWGVMNKWFENVQGMYKNFFSRNTPDTDSTDFGTAVVLGGLLGSPFGIVGQVREQKHQYELFYGSEASKPNVISKFFGGKEKKATKGLLKVFSENFIDFAKNIEPFKNKDGSINEQAFKSATEASVDAFLNDFLMDHIIYHEGDVNKALDIVNEKLKSIDGVGEQLDKLQNIGAVDEALKLLQGDQILDVLRERQMINYMMPFVTQEGGMELLKEHIPVLLEGWNQRYMQSTGVEMSQEKKNEAQRVLEETSTKMEDRWKRIDFTHNKFTIPLDIYEDMLNYQISGKEGETRDALYHEFFERLKLTKYSILSELEHLESRLSEIGEEAKENEDALVSLKRQSLKQGIEKKKEQWKEKTNIENVKKEWRNYYKGIEELEKEQKENEAKAEETNKSVTDYFSDFYQRLLDADYSPTFVGDNYIFQSEKEEEISYDVENIPFYEDEETAGFEIIKNQFSNKYRIFSDNKMVYDNFDTKQEAEAFISNLALKKKSEEVDALIEKYDPNFSMIEQEASQTSEEGETEKVSIIDMALSSDVSIKENREIRDAYDIIEDEKGRLLVQFTTLEGNKITFDKQFILEESANRYINDLIGYFKYTKELAKIDPLVATKTRTETRLKTEKVTSNIYARDVNGNFVELTTILNEDGTYDYVVGDNVFNIRTTEAKDALIKHMRDDLELEPVSLEEYKAIVAEKKLNDMRNIKLQALDEVQNIIIQGVIARENEKKEAENQLEKSIELYNQEINDITKAIESLEEEIKKGETENIKEGLEELRNRHTALKESLEKEKEVFKISMEKNRELLDKINDQIGILRNYIETLDYLRTFIRKSKSFEPIKEYLDIVEKELRRSFGEEKVAELNEILENQTEEETLSIIQKQTLELFALMGQETNEYTKVLDSMNQEKDKYIEKIKSLREFIIKADAQIEKINEINNDLTNKISDIEKAEAEEQKKRLQKEIEQAKFVLRNVQNQLLQLRDDIAKKQNDYYNSNPQLKLLTNERRYLEIRSVFEKFNEKYEEIKDEYDNQYIEKDIEQQLNEEEIIVDEEKELTLEEKGFMNIDPMTTTGLHIQHDGKYNDVYDDQGIVIPNENLDQQEWFKTTANTNAEDLVKNYTLEAMSKEKASKMKDYMPRKEYTDNTIIVFLKDKNGFVKKNGRYLYTTLLEPSKFVNRMAPQYFARIIQNTIFNAVGAGNGLVMDPESRSLNDSAFTIVKDGKNITITYKDLIDNNLQALKEAFPEQLRSTSSRQIIKIEERRYKDWYQKLLSETNNGEINFKITGKTNGHIIKYDRSSEKKNKLTQNFEDILLPYGDFNFSKYSIKISTGTNVSFKGNVYNLDRGTVYLEDKENSKIVVLNSNTLQDSDIDLVFAIFRDMAQKNGVNVEYNLDSPMNFGDFDIKTIYAVGKKLGNKRLPYLLKSIMNWGIPNVERYGYNFNIFFDNKNKKIVLKGLSKAFMEDYGLVSSSYNISIDTFKTDKDNRAKQILRAFLKTKNKNVNKYVLENLKEGRENKTYYHPIMKDGKIKFEHYSSYEAYLVESETIVTNTPTKNELESRNLPQWAQTNVTFDENYTVNSDKQIKTIKETIAELPLDQLQGLYLRIQIFAKNVPRVIEHLHTGEIKIERMRELARQSDSINLVDGFNVIHLVDYLESISVETTEDFIDFIQALFERENEIVDLQEKVPEESSGDNSPVEKLKKQDPVFIISLGQTIGRISGELGDLQKGKTLNDLLDKVSQIQEPNIKHLPGYLSPKDAMLYLVKDLEVQTLQELLPILQLIQDITEQELAKQPVNNSIGTPQDPIEIDKDTKREIARNKKGRKKKKRRNPKLLTPVDILKNLTNIGVIEKVCK